MNKPLRFIFWSLLFIFIGCQQNISSPKDARKSLTDLNISFSKESFFNRVDEGDIVAVHLFLAADMNTNFKLPRQKIRNATTPLSRASYEGRKKMVQALLEGGADPNLKDVNSLTPLMYASSQGFYKIDSLLLRKGAEPNIKNHNLETALTLAKNKNNTKILTLLKKAGAKEKNEVGSSNGNHSNRRVNSNSNQNTTQNARVTGSDVIIRSDHTTESDVTGVVKKVGSYVSILDEYYPSNSNEAILKRDVSVYVNNHSIELHKGKAVSVVSTSGNQVHVKFATEKDAQVTTTIKESDIESINSKKWYKVRTKDNTTGWIYGKFIEELQ